MGEVLGSARNIFLTLTENGQLVPQIEVVLITASPEYIVKTVPSGNINLERSDKMSDIRFFLTSEGARNLAVNLVKWADESENARKLIDKGGNKP